MKREVIGQCPVCGDGLKVSKLSCHNCQTQIEGTFELCDFCKLTREQKSFIKVFLKNRGNIKEIEKELGISYPTVRNKLDDVIEAFGFHVVSQAQVNKKEVLEKLNKGEITAEEAVRLLSD